MTGRPARETAGTADCVTMQSVKMHPAIITRPRSIDVYRSIVKTTMPPHVVPHPKNPALALEPLQGSLGEFLGLFARIHDSAHRNSLITRATQVIDKLNITVQEKISTGSFKNLILFYRWTGDVERRYYDAPHQNYSNRNYHSSFLDASWSGSQPIVRQILHAEV